MLAAFARFCIAKSNARVITDERIGFSMSEEERSRIVEKGVAPTDAEDGELSNPQQRPSLS